ncbi:leucine-rich repeat protein [Flavobacterium hungaricum]|uniref:Leucine rich repeat-containing protein n=1 Tax=Flavobacterium hungaricum TaxID=2082725 RepID=A0ABR9TTM2_9FLAO|nr:leucine-rich repeat protein [Flavobacterium hungaricum]MBE8727987.1 hypothetical protein [Flavobacterium hungaricum]
MGVTSKKYYFGKVKAIANTFIGGVSATLNTPALVAAKLGIAAYRIKVFSIVGSDIQFAITGGSYVIPVNAFNGNTAITYYYDTDYLITGIGNNAFFGTTNLAAISELRNCITLGIASFLGSSKITTIVTPKVTTIGEACFRSCSKIVEFNFPELVTCNSASATGNTGTFENCTSLQRIYMPKCKTVTGYRLMQNCSSLLEFYAPQLTQLGITLNNDANFNTIKTGCTITVPVALQTINSGSPDGDLVYASGTRGATIIYV